MGGFTFDVLAYRRVTEEEAYHALGMWMRNSRRKTVPKSGYAEIVTILGFDEE